MDFDKLLNLFVKNLGLPEEELEELKKSWVFQKKGIINQYKPDIHQGTQPIRVVHNMLVYMFSQSHPSFSKELQEQVKAGELNSKIDFIFAEDAIRHENGFHTPRVIRDTKSIQLHETFLSFLWCTTYSIYTLYVEIVDNPAMNKFAGYTKYPISEANIEMAKAIFGYAKSLIAFYSLWDKDYFPNPENYMAENRNYIEQTNIFYTEAVKFILAHEYTHLKLHIEQVDDQTPISSFLAFEQEADDEAIHNTLKGLTETTHFGICGIIIGLLSMLFFSAKTTGERHPNTEDRITNALERLPIDDNHYAWGMACVGLELWEEQFNLHFDWLPQPNSPKQQYYHLLHQIKKQN